MISIAYEYLVQKYYVCCVPIRTVPRIAWRFSIAFTGRILIFSLARGFCGVESCFRCCAHFVRWTDILYWRLSSELSFLSTSVATCIVCIVVSLVGLHIYCIFTWLFASVLTCQSCTRTCRKCWVSEPTFNIFLTWVRLVFVNINNVLFDLFWGHRHSLVFWNWRDNWEVDLSRVDYYWLCLSSEFLSVTHLWAIFLVWCR